jgi:hypothetical protein
LVSQIWFAQCSRAAKPVNATSRFTDRTNSWLPKKVKVALH